MIDALAQPSNAFATPEPRPRLWPNPCPCLSSIGIAEPSFASLAWFWVNMYIIRRNGPNQNSPSLSDTTQESTRIAFISSKGCLNGLYTFRLYEWKLHGGLQLVNKLRPTPKSVSWCSQVSPRSAANSAAQTEGWNASSKGLSVTNIVTRIMTPVKTGLHDYSRAKTLLKEFQLLMSFKMGMMGHLADVKARALITHLETVCRLITRNSDRFVRPQSVGHGPSRLKVIQSPRQIIIQGCPSPLLSILCEDRMRSHRRRTGMETDDWRPIMWAKFGAQLGLGFESAHYLCLLMQWPVMSFHSMPLRISLMPLHLHVMLSLDCAVPVWASLGHFEILGNYCLNLNPCLFANKTMLWTVQPVSKW